MPRITSTAYNSYLKKFSPYFLRKYQTETYFKLGRATNFEVLVMKYMCDHLNTEEDHSFKHKTPIWLTNLSHRLGWSLSLYMLVVFSFFLGKQKRVFNTFEITPGGYGQSSTALPYRYEDVYVLQKAMDY